jgi:hypothetical protein
VCVCVCVLHEFKNSSAFEDVYLVIIIGKGLCSIHYIITYSNHKDLIIDMI